MARYGAEVLTKADRSRVSLGEYVAHHMPSFPEHLPAMPTLPAKLQVTPRPLLGRRCREGACRVYGSSAWGGGLPRRLVCVTPLVRWCEPSPP